MDASRLGPDIYLYIQSTGVPFEGVGLSRLEGADPVDIAQLRIVIAPNCSLSVRGALVFFAGMCTVSFTIAGFMAALGFWPVFPFAGLEMAVLAWALKASLERRRQLQTITVSDRDVLVESRSGGTRFARSAAGS